MEKRWITFKDNITILDDKTAKYEDQEGNYAILDILKLVVGVEYDEFNKDQYNQALFQKLIPKDMKLNITKKKTQVLDKNDKTKIVDAEEDVRQVWFIRDSLGNIEAYNNKEEAIKTAKEWNDKIMKVVMAGGK
jgi:hypothetical protein